MKRFSNFATKKELNFIDMAICFAVRKSILDADLVLDSQFYDPRKLEYLNKLSKQSKQKISDEFSEIVDLTSSQAKLNFPSFIYNLTDSLGNLFTDGKIANSADDIGSTKKIAQPNDFAVSRLRYYLKEFGVVPAAIKYRICCITTKG